MGHRARGSTTLIVIILLAGIVFAVTNVLVLMLTVRGPLSVPLLDEFYRICAPCVFYFIAAPLVVSILTALMVHQLQALVAPGPPSGSSQRQSAAAPKPSPAAALRLLALLQQEGRFMDFLQEDIDGYSDAQVGAAVRSIHAGCRKALTDRITVQRIFTDDDGASVVVAKGFDPAAVRLTGNVTGEPPFRGTLAHGGWRATTVALPEPPAGTDATIIAPAEIEIG